MHDTDERCLLPPTDVCRNIAWYNKCLSPEEYPLKPGKWKAFLRKAKKAVGDASRRKPCKPGETPKPRKKTVRGLQAKP